MTGARIQRDAGATTSIVSAGSGPLQAAPVSSYATSAPPHLPPEQNPLA
jgi:hypothetical protein